MILTERVGAESWRLLSNHLFLFSDFWEKEKDIKIMDASEGGDISDMRGAAKGRLQLPKFKFGWLTEQRKWWFRNGKVQWNRIKPQSLIFLENIKYHFFLGLWKIPGSPTPISRRITYRLDPHNFQVAHRSCIIYSDRPTYLYTSLLPLCYRDLTHFFHQCLSLFIIGINYFGRLKLASVNLYQISFALTQTVPWWVMKTI